MLGMEGSQHAGGAGAEGQHGGGREAAQVIRLGHGGPHTVPAAGLMGSRTSPCASECHVWPVAFSKSRRPTRSHLLLQTRLLLRLLQPRRGQRGRQPRGSRRARWTRAAAGERAMECRLRPLAPKRK